MEEPIITHTPPDKTPEKAPMRGGGYMREQVEIVAPPVPKKKKVSYLKRNLKKKTALSINDYVLTHYAYTNSGQSEITLTHFFYSFFFFCQKS